MEQYNGFAQVYDMFMSDIPYDEWADTLERVLKDHGIDDGLVLELGCGTGNLTRRLRDRGYDMTGVDSSSEMLAIAFEKDKEGILYLLQDMREFELYGTVRAVFSLCDSLNYILDEDDLLTVFRLVNNYLDPGGLFVFDMKTEYLYREVFADNSFTENRDEGSLIWENFYDEDTQTNEYDITIYVRSGDDLYRRFEENHIQRAYAPETVKRLLEEAGLHFVGIYGEGCEGDPDEDSERVYFVARECTKNGENYD